MGTFRGALEAPFAWADPDGFGAPAGADDGWVVLASAGASPAPGLQRVLRAWIEARPDVDLFYGDDADRTGPRLKPEFDRALLAAKDYIGGPVAVRASLLNRLGWGGSVYDMVLRADAAGAGVARIPLVLATWPGERPAGPSIEARAAALRAWIGARPMEVGPGLTPDTLQLMRRFVDFPAVTLVVPTRQSGPATRPYVVELLDSLEATDWPRERLEVLVGDDTDRAATLPEGRWSFPVRRMATPRPEGRPFNYAAKMNRLWRAAGTEHLVLMNDDVTVRDGGWLKALMTFAADPDVGGVGARLLFPDGRLQHAGVVGGLFDGVAHAWFGQAADQPTYQDWALVHRDWSMVTGAVFATRRAALEAVDGFDERFSLEFNDVDLCLRMRLLGLRIVYTPFAELTHREKASRGEAPAPGDQTALFMNRWRDLLADDPAYHPRLTRDRFAPTPVEG